MTDYLWLIPLFPLAGSAINGVAGRWLPKSAISIIACGASGLSFITALLSFFELLKLAPNRDKC